MRYHSETENLQQPLLSFSSITIPGGLRLSLCTLARHKSQSIYTRSVFQRHAIDNGYHGNKADVPLRSAYFSSLRSRWPMNGLFSVWTFQSSRRPSIVSSTATKVDIGAVQPKGRTCSWMCFYLWEVSQAWDYINRPNFKTKISFHIFHHFLFPQFQSRMTGIIHVCDVVIYSSCVPNFII